MMFGIEMPNTKFHPRYIFVHIVMTIGGVMHINGIYETWPQFTKLCLPFAIYFLVIQLVARLINRVNLDDEKRITDLKNTVVNFYKQEEVNTNLLLILKRGANSTNHAIKSYLALSFIIYHTPIIASWIVSYRSGVYELFAQWRLPYTSNEILTEYMINSFFALITSLAVYLSFMHQDMVFIFHACQTIPMAEVLSCKLHLLGVELVQSKENMENQCLKIKELSNRNLRNWRVAEYLIAKKSFEDIEDKLHEMIIQQETYNNYIKQMVKSYQATAFMALSLNSVALGLTLITFRFVSIPIGLAFSAILLFQVLLPCANGYLINKQNEKLLDAVYDFPWYELSAKKMKSFLQFLLVCQHTKTLTLTIIGDVDMELFTNFVNASYSYFMFLVEFVKH